MELLKGDDIGILVRDKLEMELAEFFIEGFDIIKKCSFPLVLIRRNDCLYGSKEIKVKKLMTISELSEEYENFNN